MNNQQYIIDFDNKIITVFVDDSIIQEFTLSEAYLDNKHLFLGINKDLTIDVDLEEILSLTDEIEFINNTKIEIKDLSNEILFNESILDMNFSDEDGSLMMVSNKNGLYFTIINEG